MIQIIAFIYAGAGGLEGVRTFETQAIPILRAHQAVLLTASSSSKPTDGPTKFTLSNFQIQKHLTPSRQIPDTLSLQI